MTAYAIASDVIPYSTLSLAGYDVCQRLRGNQRGSNVANMGS